jgi:hypothetical protein
MANRTFCEVTPNISSPIAPEIRTDPGRKPA